MRILTGATLADGRTVDVTVGDDGRIVAVAEVVVAGTNRVTGDADDLTGFLLLPAPAEPHAHLDKALSADVVVNRTGDLPGAIDAWTAARGSITEDDVVARATSAVHLAVAHGVTAIRTHVDVGEDIGARNVRALHRVREATAHLVDLRLVALVSSPLSGSEGEGNRRALAEAIALGVDVVGGCPHIDPRPDEVIRLALDAASEAGLPVDLHMDETLDPHVLTVVSLARQVRDRGFPHPVTASHCVSLGMQEPAAQAKVAAELAGAGIAVVTLPQTNLFLQGRQHPRATPRGLTAIRALLDAGVTVAGGGDNVQDPFNLVGRGDPLETASLLVAAGHLPPDDAYAMVAGSARSVVGLAPVSVSAGDPADLVAVRAATVRGAVAEAPGTRRTYRRGLLVARSDQQTVIAGR